MREAVRNVLRLASAPAWADYIMGPADLAKPNAAASDVEVDAFITARTRSAYHVVGTSSMSIKSEKAGVADPDLRVKEVVGVRVVDALVLPFAPAGHSQAAIYALSEKGADLIQAEYA